MKEYKIVVLGNGGVGKSALTLQFVQGVFTPHYDATIEDSYRKLSKIEAENARLEILDTAGTEQFSGMRETYYKSAHGFILVFSLEDKSTFEDLKLTYENIARIRGKDVPLILVGNKSDLIGTRQIDQQFVEDHARTLNIPYFETSAKLNQNVAQIFEECAILILKRGGVKENINSDSTSTIFKSCCCFL
ncbi:unnamed protein product [Caenorhabditis angaria]|uniref:Uncharacterized protein n=1 Tax=Caenorhabditis angaria TaxID=860376 RepID=A0A9P1IQN2_9PELO|nr:unnamed protein product [Caenorhabditis angaria]